MASLTAPTGGKDMSVISRAADLVGACQARAATVRPTVIRWPNWLLSPALTIATLSGSEYGRTSTCWPAMASWNFARNAIAACWPVPAVVPSGGTAVEGTRAAEVVAGAVAGLVGTPDAAVRAVVAGGPFGRTLVTELPVVGALVAGVKAGCGTPGGLTTR